MKKKLGKLLACMLALALLVTSGNFSVLQVSAAGNEETNVFKELEKTADSIVFEVKQDTEYALRVIGEDGTAAWKWADAKQYDLEKNTVTFKELKSDTEYQFACRPKGSTDEKDLKTITLRTPLTNPAKEEPAKQDAPKEEPPKQEPPKQEPPKQEPPKEEPPKQEPPKQEPVKQEPPKQEPPKQEPPKEEPPKQEPPKEELPKQEPAHTTPVEKIAAPAAPEAASYTDTTITLKQVENQEYALFAEDKELTWTDTNTFENLTPDTEYNFVTRIKGSDDAEPSEISKPLSVKTKKSAAKAPAAPELKSRTDVSITVKAIESQEYALVIDDTIGKWNTTGTFEGLNPATKYRIITRMAYNDDTQMPSKNSEELSVTTKKSAAKAPETPKLAERGEDYISLQTSENLRYAISVDGKDWKWQDSGKFTDLKAGTAYQFAARAAYDSDNEMESLISSSAAYKTYMKFTGSIGGITPNASYNTRTELTATASGTGMDNKSPASGDSRWIPKTWNWDGKNNRTWTKAPYSVTFLLNKAGDYKLTVSFELEEYLGDSWKSTGKTKELSVSFKAVAPIYTITSSAGKNGKISPSGTVKVEDGKNAEFTFTPDKNYRVAKVLVDGNAVKFKNNKYTFTDVSKDHKISVTFEYIDDKAAPKTGDTSPVTILLALMAASVAFITILLAAKKKRLNNL